MPDTTPQGESSKATCIKIQETVQSLREVEMEHGWRMDEMLLARAKRLCQELVDLGHWPATGNNKYNYPAYQMWQNYGIDWHVFREPWYCPECKSDLRDRDAGTPFKREIGIIVNDRVHHWRCPDCGATWPRGTNPNPV